jgi:hypothetical protein
VNRLVFDIGALYYDVVTTRLPEWRADCRKLTEHFVSDARVILDLGTGPGVSAYETTNSMPQATVVVSIFLSPCFDARCAIVIATGTSISALRLGRTQIAENG